MKKSRYLLFILACIISFGPVFASQRVILLSWDGAADWIVDKLLEEGDLPNVAKLAKKGVRAEYMTTSFPSLTAPGHASIWTGAYGNRNGVTGNRVPILPKSEHTFVETISGFDTRALTAEPIWMTVVRSGRSAAVLQATQSEPTEIFARKVKGEGIPPERLYLATGYAYSISPPGVIADPSAWQDARPPLGFPLHAGSVKRLRFKVGDTNFTAYEFDHKYDPAQGFDTVMIEADGSTAKTVLKPGWSAPGTTNRFSQPFEVRKDDWVGYIHFRLFALSPDGSEILLYRTAANSLDSNDPGKAAAVLKAAGGFSDAGFKVYESGKLGKPVYAGGDDSAERRVLELVRLDIEKLKRSTAYGMANLQWDLLINYSPNIDAAEHVWLGVLDPQSPAYDAETARKIWPFLKEVYRLNDEWLGDVLKKAPKDAAVVLLSDHGMEGVAKLFYTNRFLERAGLAKLNLDGTVDPNASRAAAIGDGASIYVNTTDYKGGIVPADQKEAILQQVTSLLLSATDPENGRSVVIKVFRADDAPDVGTGGPKGADLMIDLIDGYDPRPTGGTPDVIFQRIGPIGRGAHGGFPYEPRLRAVFFASGSGIAKGKTIPPIRAIDVAPTVSRLLGIHSPANAVGDPVAAALRPGR